MVGFAGEAFGDVDEYLRHLAAHLPEAYRASRDMKDYADTLRDVAAGKLTAEEAGKKSPQLKRSEAVCPCSNSVRWVPESAALISSAAEPAGSGGGAGPA
jgi:hypothetical protein